MRCHLEKEKEADTVSKTKKSELMQLMENRKNLYHLFSRFFQKETDQQFYDRLSQIVFPAECRENDGTEFERGIQRLEEYFEYDTGETIDDLAADYAKTFLGAGNADGNAAFPYESVYTSPKRIMMQEAWSEVSEIYEEKGIERSEEALDLLEDHISVELDYMAFLCSDTARFTEIRAGLEEQREFLNRHLLNWVPALCLDIEKYADTEFYRMAAQLTSGFLQLDGFLLDRMITECKAGEHVSKSFCLSRDSMNRLLAVLQENYRIYGPKLLEDQGDWGSEGLVRYQEITSLDEMVTDRQSDFSPKEVIYPISQTIFTFNEDQCMETVPEDTKGIIIFMHPCDINGLKRLDNMFLANGGTSDIYYKRMRDRVKVFMMECEKSWDNCYCVSMGTNRTDNYSVAFRFDGQNVFVKVKDGVFADLFEGQAESSYEPVFVEENDRKVRIPDIDDKGLLRPIFELDFWKEYNESCIACGGCNTVCPTCSCFDTVDYLNQENSRRGERRRIWSSCMLPDFSRTAGGNIARKKPEQMMRFKTMHKIYDYNARFGGGEHMCVGCGRCIGHCVENICFADTINRLSDEVDRLKAERANGGERNEK